MAEKGATTAPAKVLRLDRVLPVSLGSSPVGPLHLSSLPPPVWLDYVNVKSDTQRVIEPSRPRLSRPSEY